MTRFAITLFIAAAFAATAAAQPLFPQQPPSIPKPTISPYMNLLRNGPAYLNYYGLVKPQQDARRALEGLQQQVTGLQNASSNVYGGTGSELSTGKQVGYFTHSRYFMNMNGVQSGLPMSAQMSTAGNNTLFRPQPQGQNSLMPYNR